MEPLNPIHVARIEKLRDFLRTLSPERFNIDHYGNLGRDGSLEKLKAGVCGTACAIGYCPIVFPDDWTYTMPWGQEASYVPLLKSRLGEYVCVEDSVEEFFGIRNSSAEFDQLFMPTGYDLDPTPQDVADKLDLYLAGKLHD